MTTQVLRVERQGEAFAVQSQKAEGGQMNKCLIVLQDFGGQYADRFAAVMLGKNALLRFYPGDVVAVTMRFSTNEYEGKVYQDILVTDIAKVG
jgi:spermidine/putrescine-binding protein